MKLFAYTLIFCFLLSACAIRDVELSDNPSAFGGQPSDAAENVAIPFAQSDAAQGTLSMRTPAAWPMQDLEDFSADAMSIVEQLYIVHPMFIYHERTPENFAQASEDYLAATAAPMSFPAFVMETQRFLAEFGDGHLSRTFQTQTWEWNQAAWEWERSELGLFQHGYFMDMHFIARDTGFFLAESAAGPITAFRVESIGGVDIHEITGVIDMHYGRYNEAGRLRNHSRYARYELVLRMAGAELFLQDDRMQVDVVLVRKDEQGNETARMTAQVGFVPEHPTSYRLPQYLETPFAQYERLGDAFYIRLTFLQMEESTTNAIEATRAALQAGVRHFIIDLRGTPGGDPEVGYQLLEAMGITPPMHGKLWRIHQFTRESYEYWGSIGLLNLRYFRHLTPSFVVSQEYIYIPRNMQSENPYGVQVIALTSNRTFSGGTTLAATIADADFGLVIGEPSATSPSYYGWGFGINTESGIIVRPHVTYYLRPDAEADQHVLWPDLYVDAWRALDAAIYWLAEIGVIVSNER